MATLMLVDLAKELGQKNRQTGLVTWDISEHLTLCVDIQNKKVYYCTKPGGVAIQEKVSQDDILITISAIRFVLANTIDKFTSQVNIYNRFAVLHFAKEALLVNKDYVGERFFVKEGYIFFMVKSGHVVYQPGEEVGTWFQLRQDTRLSKLKRVNQVNSRRDIKYGEILRSHVLKFR